MYKSEDDLILTKGSMILIHITNKDILIKTIKSKELLKQWNAKFQPNDFLTIGYIMWYYPIKISHL